MPETVRVLGVPVDVVSEVDVLDFIGRRVAEREVSQVVTVNAEYVMRARVDSVFKRVIESADLRTPDGAGVVWAARRRGAMIQGRVGGSDLIWSVSEQAARTGQRVFLLGGAEGVAACASRVLQTRYPGLQVCGTFAGSPTAGRDDEQRRLIREAKPDVLFVAFGAPEQDLWIARAKRELQVPVSMGVGGSFDYVAGIAKRAPLTMQRLGLEWLYRLVRQPWRWRRMLVLPVFAALAGLRRD